MKVPLHFVNSEVAPGVKLSGGIVSHVMNDLEVVCLPKDLPAFIEVDLGHLAAGDSVHLSELKLPAGVETVVTQGGEDPVVATCVLPRAAVEEEAEAAAATAGTEIPLVAVKEEKEAEKK
jgi:large subunit ribosomal protein L25